MKNGLLALVLVGSLSVLNGCGGGTTTPPPILATQFSVTPATSSPKAGTAFMITVTAQGAAGQTASSYSGTLHFASSDSNANLPGDSPMTGVTGTFSVTLNTAGAQTITVTDTQSLKGVSNAITVGASGATHFSVSVAINVATIGTPLNFTVTAADTLGNTVTTYSGTVHFTTSDSAAVLPADATLTNGVGNFSITMKTSGAQTITATDKTSNSITGTSNAIQVSGPATHFSVGSAGTGATRSPVLLLVAALDASNNSSTGYSGTVRITSSDKSAILPANAVLNGGLANFQITFETSGSQTATATDTVTSAITGSSSPIAVSATAPLSITSGNPPNGTVGSSYGTTTTTYEVCPPTFPGGGSCRPCVPNTIAGCGANLPFCGHAPPFVACIAKIVFSGFALTGTGGVRPYTWTASSLPPGLNLKPSSISGTPTPGTAATYQTMITLNDAGQPPAPFTATYSIVISNPPPPVVSSPSLFPGATINQPFSYSFSATAGLPPYSNWKVTGTLPTGILPITNAGVLAGTPTTTGSFPIMVTVDDSVSQVSAAQAFNLQVYPHGFKPDGAMGTPRTSDTATLLTDGTVLIAGGLGLASAEKYDPTTAKFTPTGSMSMPRDSHTATRLASGKVLIAGGGGLGGDPVTATAELFDPATGIFTLTGSMSVARTGHNATLLSDGKVLITGGGTTTAELYDPSTGKFTPTTGLLTTARTNDTATLLPSGKVLITGGFNSGALATAELYDPAKETFAATGSMAATRVSQTATLLTTGPNTGKVVVAGGATTAAELFDPATGTFSATGPMAAALAGQTATLLSDGTVLMAGGSDVNGIIAAAELYDSNSGTFSGTGGLQTAREAHTATLLKDGTVLVTGGVNPVIPGGILATVELYQ
jgi:hypothetical protein